MRWIAQSAALAGICAAGLTCHGNVAAQPAAAPEKPAAATPPAKPTMAAPAAKPDKPTMATPPGAAPKADKGPPSAAPDHRGHKHGADAKHDSHGKPPHAGPPGASRGPDKASHKDFKARLESLRKDRKERRRAQSDALIRLWGKEVLARPPVRAELEHHAWRIARLERMKALLEESDHKNKTKLLARVEKLIERENERHKKHMEKLRADGPGAGTAAAPGAPPGTVPANPAVAKTLPGAAGPKPASAPPSPAAPKTGPATPAQPAQPAAKTGSAPAAPAGGAQ